MLQSSLFFCFLIIPLCSAISYFTLNFITFYFVLFLPFNLHFTFLFVLSFSHSYYPTLFCYFIFCFVLYYILFRPFLAFHSSLFFFRFLKQLFHSLLQQFPFFALFFTSFCFVLFNLHFSFLCVLSFSSITFFHFYSADS